MRLKAIELYLTKKIKNEKKKRKNKTPLYMFVFAVKKIYLYYICVPRSESGHVY